MTLRPMAKRAVGGEGPGHRRRVEVLKPLARERPRRARFLGPGRRCPPLRPLHELVREVCAAAARAVAVAALEDVRATAPGDADVFSATIQPPYSLLKMTRFVQSRT